MGRWRAAVLIGVHVVIAVHVALWLAMGMTLSPVEPSESMQTLREGAVNAGFVFFSLAILSTLVFGRFFCGWGCHVVALQDLCFWLMGRCGIRPKPFRSRLLIWAPLLLALYMFVWPVFHREVLRPLLMDHAGRMPAWLGQSDPILQYRSEFLVRDFWATFPTWYVAVPFLLVCGFAAVYFLGSKGFCTYGCPYGGFFAPVDRLAPGKIRVTDDCEGCGHCTAVCTSNVRVHEEVRDFGAVVDPGCMKCLDCVSACPNDALYFGFGKPTVLTRPRGAGARARRAEAKARRAARYDLDLPEELAAGALFLAFFLAFRGMLNQVPMLMAVAMGVIGAFLSWKTWSLLRPSRPNVRLHGWQLRLKGRVRPAGWGVAGLTVLVAAAAVWSGYVRATRWRADAVYATMETPLAAALRPDYAASPAELGAAERALSLYARSRPWSEPAPATEPPQGWSIGWPYTPAERLNIAYLHVITGDLAAAERGLREVVERGSPKDALVIQLGQIMLARGAAPDEVAAMYAGALRAHPDLHEIRGLVASRGMLTSGQRGDDAPSSDALREQASLLPRTREEAEKLWDSAPAESADAAPLLGKAAFLAELGEAARARELLAMVVEHAHDSRTLLGAAGLHLRIGDRPRAAELAERAASRSSRDPGVLVGAADVLAAAGEHERALGAADRAVARARRIGPYSGGAGVLVSAGLLNLDLGRADAGLRLLREAADLARDAEWDLGAIGMQLSQRGAATGDARLLNEGVEIMRRAVAAAPGSPTLRHDLAAALFGAGRGEEAVREMIRAATEGAENPFLAERCAGLLAVMGRRDEAERWLAAADARAARYRTQRPAGGLGSGAPPVP